jgi:hypothetical protein
MSSHEEMLMKHINELHARGQDTEAKKVIDVLVKHRQEMAKMAPPPRKISPDSYFDDEFDIYRSVPITRSAQAKRAFTNDEMLCMRMRWPTPVHGQDWHLGFSHVATHNVGDKVHVWVITKDAQSAVLEDDAAIFPSDALITKLNMLKQE